MIVEDFSAIAEELAKLMHNKRPDDQQNANEPDADSAGETDSLGLLDYSCGYF